MHTGPTQYAANASPIPCRIPVERWRQQNSFDQPTLALSFGNTAPDATTLICMMAGRRKICQGERVYRQFDRANFIYAVKSGSFKSTLALSDGSERVSSFHMTDELLGLDGVAEGRHASSATALEDSEVCMMSHSRLYEPSMSTFNLQLTLIRLISRELERGRLSVILSANLSATPRLAGFLLSHSAGLKGLGYSAVEFHLKMPRSDIASFLGVAFETVSRSFAELQQLRLLKVERRHIQITDLQGLSELKI